MNEYDAKRELTMEPGNINQASSEWFKESFQRSAVHSQMAWLHTAECSVHVCLQCLACYTQLSLGRIQAVSWKSNACTMNPVKSSVSTDERLYNAGTLTAIACIYANIEVACNESNERTK